MWGTWRVNGQLAVSRAIGEHTGTPVAFSGGDGEYKPYVIATPDVTTIVRNGSEDFLIGECRGVITE